MNSQEWPARAGRRIRILVVDDEVDLLQTLTWRFEASGDFTVETATDGLSALAKARVFLPDVVLLDLVMPQADGFELCRRLREDPATAGVPVVMMTAHPGASVEDEARRVGIHRVLLKPFDPRELAQSLEDALPPPSPEAA